jgi:hypothetical protein
MVCCQPLVRRRTDSRTATGREDDHRGEVRRRRQRETPKGGWFASPRRDWRRTERTTTFSVVEAESYGERRGVERGGCAVRTGRRISTRMQGASGLSHRGAR